jgi:disulfide bond formation protein DsbB
MKKLLFPHSFRKVGYVLLVPFLALGIAYLGWNYEIPWLNYHPEGHGSLSFMNTNFTDELATIGLIVSLILVAFSKEKIEDEAIQFFRLEALQWAVYANYLVLVLAVLFCYGGLFFTVMTINLFTVLIIFIARFRFVLYQSNKSNL